MVINRVGALVRGGDFYGRDALVDLIWQKLRNDNILLAPPRRFGKTSVMYRCSGSNARLTSNTTTAV